MDTPYFGEIISIERYSEIYKSLKLSHNISQCFMQTKHLEIEKIKKAYPRLWKIIEDKKIIDNGYISCFLKPSESGMPSDIGEITVFIKSPNLL